MRTAPLLALVLTGCATISPRREATTLDRSGSCEYVVGDESRAGREAVSRGIVLCVPLRWTRVSAARWTDGADVVVVHQARAATGPRPVTLDVSDAVQWRMPVPQVYSGPLAFDQALQQGSMQPVAVRAVDRPVFVDRQWREQVDGRNMQLRVTSSSFGAWSVSASWDSGPASLLTLTGHAQSVAGIDEQIAVFRTAQPATRPRSR